MELKEDINSAGSHSNGEISLAPLDSVKGELRAFWDPGGILLLCSRDQNASSFLRKILKSWIGGLIQPKDSKQALMAISNYPVNMVVYWEGFDEGREGGIWEYLCLMTGEQRRRLVVVWVSEDVCSGDARAAFCKSADLAIHPKDLSKLPQLLKRTLRENLVLYEQFLATLGALYDRG